MICVATDVTEEVRVTEEQRIRTIRQAVVAGLGQEALDGLELSQVMDKAAQEIASQIELPLSAVFELPEGDRRLHLRAGVGWQPGLVGALAIEATPQSPVGAVLACGEPLVIEDLRADDRWPDADYLREHGVVSAACRLIGHPDLPLGVLGAYSTTPRRFGKNELDFLQTMANVVGGATQRDRAEADARHQALHDILTGLANRALFLDHLEVALARARRHPGSVGLLFVDLDRFKTVNDSLGHAAGNRLLRLLADRLREVVRPGDTIARLAGDEFAVLCEDLEDERAASVVARRILRAFAAPASLEEREVVVTASIGIAIGNPGDDPEQLLRDADAAMYRAKERGKARYELFDEAMRARAHDRLELENDLRRAIDTGQLRLVYQPMLSIDSGQVCGVEALVRWQHPVRGLLGPASFVSLAEETGLIVPLGAWVLGEALAQTRLWGLVAGEHPLEVSVNVSARQLNDPGFPRSSPRRWSRPSCRW
jgi:diguanylate cyclase (GGDEF)-like protein